MKNREKTILLRFLILAVMLFALVGLKPQAQDRNPKQSMQQRINKNTPITEFNAVLPNNPQERLLREKRSKKGNVRDSAGRELPNIKSFELTEARNSRYGGFDSHAPAEPAIPGAKSDSIVIGVISNPQAFITGDRVSVYSEFTLKVNEVLKNNTPQPIAPNDLITISRGGGGVRFSSGKIIELLFDGKPMPEVGKRYVFFLKHDNDTEDFPIITGYELSPQGIIPLDGIKRGGEIPYQLASHQSYKGVDTNEFLNITRQVVKASVDIFVQSRE